MADGDSWCRHRVVFDRDIPLCEAGVEYWAFRDESVKGTAWMDNLPCLGRNAAARARCAKYEARTPEEIAERNRSGGLTLVAFSLCLADAGKKPRPHRGTIECPKCNGTLDYLAKATKRATIWGKCRTADCLAWMV